MTTGTTPQSGERRGLKRKAAALRQDGDDVRRQGWASFDVSQSGLGPPWEATSPTSLL